MNTVNTVNFIHSFEKIQLLFTAFSEVNEFEINGYSLTLRLSVHPVQDFDGCDISHCGCKVGFQRLTARRINQDYFSLSIF